MMKFSRAKLIMLWCEVVSDVKLWLSMYRTIWLKMASHSWTSFDAPHCNRHFKRFFHKYVRIKSLYIIARKKFIGFLRAKWGFDVEHRSLELIILLMYVKRICGKYWFYWLTKAGNIFCWLLSNCWSAGVEGEKLENQSTSFSVLPFTLFSMLTLSKCLAVGEIYF